MNNNIPKIGIITDASYLKKTNYLEWQFKSLETGEILFNEKVTDCKAVWLINIGEFLGIVSAVKYVVENELDLNIYADSLTAIRWARNKKVNSWVIKADPFLSAKVDNAVKYLKGIKVLPNILKWQTSDWGENPADFGRK